MPPATTPMLSAPAHPRRVSWRAKTAPLAVAAGVGAAVLVLAVRDPNQPGHYPGCVFLALTGWYCPGCGGLRSVHALAHGHLGEAVGLNAVTTLVVLPLLAAIWAEWALRTWTGRGIRLWMPPGWTSTAIGVLFVAFTLARNTTWGAALAP